MAEVSHDRSASVTRVQGQAPASPWDEKLPRLVKTLADLVLLPADRLPPQNRQLIDDALSRILPFAEASQRRMLARRLSGQSRPPRLVARALVHDHIDIAEPVLTAPGEIDDQDLISVVKLRPGAHARAIATREGLPNAVAAAIVRHAENPAVRALLRNYTVRLARPEMEAIVVRAGQEPDLVDDLLERSELPIDLGLRMFFSLDVAQRFKILQKCVIDRSIIYSSLPDDILSDLTELDQTIVDALRPLRRAPRLDAAIPEQVLVDAGEISAIALDRLARAADLKGMTLAQIFAEPRGDAFAVFAKACGLRKPLLMACLEKRFGGGAPGPSSIASRETSAEIIFDALSWDYADSIVRTWDQAYRSVSDTASIGVELLSSPQ